MLGWRRFISWLEDLGLKDPGLGAVDPARFATTEPEEIPERLYSSKVVEFPRASKKDVYAKPFGGK